MSNQAQQYPHLLQAMCDLYNGSIMCTAPGHKDLVAEQVPLAKLAVTPEQLSAAEQELAGSEVLRNQYATQATSDNRVVEVVIGAWAEHLGLD